MLALIPLGCRFGGAPAKEKRDVPTIPAARGPFRVTIEDVGVLRATLAQEIKAHEWGRVAKVATHGMAVKIGDPIISMETSELEQHLLRLDADLAEAESQKQKQLERMAFQERSSELDLAVSKAAMNFEQEKLASSRTASDDAARQRALGLISQEAADRAAERLRAAELSAAKSVLAHERKVEEIGSERRQIQVQRDETGRTWDQTSQQRDEVQKTLEKAVLRAPAAGDVFLVKQRFRGGGGERFVRIGDQVGPWSGALALIPDRSKIEVRTQVDEALVSRILPGMKVEIRVTAVEGIVLRGTVRTIAVLASPRSKSEGAGFSDDKKGVVERIVFPVIVDVAEPDPRLQPGMTVGVSFLIDVLPDAVSVPDEAVFGGASRPLVFTRGNGGWEEHEVTLGPSSNGRVVVTAGLDGTEQVYLGDPRDGGKS
jgi:multidrug resistance efflux pump